MEPLLTLKNVSAGYGSGQVLGPLDLSINHGDFISLLGRNGMGKTTTVRSIFGVAGWVNGSVVLHGRETRGSPPHRVARAGIGLVAEGRHIFPNLTVTENLVGFAADRRARSDPWTLDRVRALFPALADRAGAMGATLSGGEQQMLAIGRALMTNPDLLILDEATEGLAPHARVVIWQTLKNLKAQGLAILAIDKHLAALGELSDRHVILNKGRIVWQGTPADLSGHPELVAEHLGI